ncbi:PaaI family thioesterase [Halorubrum sp. GN11_10-6_MGM]|uniref:PaaI family thioesterase n=1 Tax=Halorubrum sp. GN11_10-6_MGM TaxID=2518112 RepID=UPI0010F4C829|nr:PaaI family thioesterase [Halorubrum sp. GN11_10-6_MGM]TKX74571.1 PaaI family thioesterase [Halorubrum sp. GN11_10-6_MGM]
MSDDPILEYFNRSPYRTLLEIEVTEAADGRAAGRLRFAEKHSSNRRRPIAQGGVAFSLADSVAGAAATALVGSPTPTIDFRIDYLAPATGDLVATADVVREGGETAVVDVTVAQVEGGRDGDASPETSLDPREAVAAGESVAVGRGVYKTSDLPADAPWDIDQGD